MELSEREQRSDACQSSCISASTAPTRRITEQGDPDAIWIDTNHVSQVANDGAGSGDPGRSAALGTADDAPDRSLVLRQSADSDEPNRSADRPGLSHDDRHPVACTCDCHGDTEGARARADLLLPSKQHAPGRLLHDLT